MFEDNALWRRDLAGAAFPKWFDIIDSTDNVRGAEMEAF